MNDLFHGYVLAADIILTNELDMIKTYLYQQVVIQNLSVIWTISKL